MKSERVQFSSLFVFHNWGGKVYFDNKPGVNAITFFGTPFYFEGLVSHGEFSSLSDVYHTTPKRIAWRTAGSVEKDGVFLTKFYDFQPIDSETAVAINAVFRTIELARKVFERRTDIVREVDSSDLYDQVVPITEVDDETLWVLNDGDLSPMHYGMHPRMISGYLKSVPRGSLLRCFSNDLCAAFLDEDDVLFLGLYRNVSTC